MNNKKIPAFAQFLTKINLLLILNRVMIFFSHFFATQSTLIDNTSKLATAATLDDWLHKYNDIQNIYKI